MCSDLFFLPVLFVPADRKQLLQGLPGVWEKQRIRKTEAISCYSGSCREADFSYATARLTDPREPGAGIPDEGTPPKG